jgi:hypothetical protein
LTDLLHPNVILPSHLWFSTRSGLFPLCMLHAHPSQPLWGWKHKMAIFYIISIKTYFLKQNSIPNNTAWVYIYMPGGVRYLVAKLFLLLLTHVTDNVKICENFSRLLHYVKEKRTSYKMFFLGMLLGLHSLWTK